MLIEYSKDKGNTTGNNIEKTFWRYDEKKNDPIGTTKSNIKGWHSKEFDLQNVFLGKFLTALNPEIQQATSDMWWDVINQIIKIKNMWSIIHTKGSCNEKHTERNRALRGA